MDIEHDKRTYLFRKSLQLTYHCQRMTSWFPVKIVALSAGGQFVSPSTFSPMNSIFDCTNFFIPADNELIHVTQINFVQAIFRLRGLADSVQAVEMLIPVTNFSEFSTNLAAPSREVVFLENHWFVYILLSSFELVFTPCLNCISLHNTTLGFLV